MHDLYGYTKKINVLHTAWVTLLITYQPPSLLSECICHTVDISKIKVGSQVLLISTVISFGSHVGNGKQEAQQLLKGGQGVMGRRERKERESSFPHSPLTIHLLLILIGDSEVTGDGRVRDSQLNYCAFQ